MLQFVLPLFLMTFDLNMIHLDLYLVYHYQWCMWWC